MGDTEKIINITTRLPRYDLNWNLPNTKMDVPAISLILQFSLFFQLFYSLRNGRFLP